MPPASQSKKPRNGDIRGFFTSAGQVKSHSPKKPASPGLSSLPDIPSSPRTPPKSAPRVFRPNEEIKGSDEEEEDESDDSLASITDALGYRPKPSPHQRNPNIPSTPQAKRVASYSNVHRSPLTLQPKRHKFDLKALLHHTKEHERTEESARQAKTLIAEADRHSDAEDESGLEDDPKRFEEAAQNFLIGDEDEGKVDKLRKAMKRTKEHNTHKQCYFFDADLQEKQAKHQFPAKTAKGPWKCLAQADARRQAFIMSLPHSLLKLGQTLPDELFLWVLEEVCIEKYAELRMQYIDLVSLCDEQIGRLVTDMRLYGLLERIGGPKYAREHSKLKCATELRPEYLERDWSGLTAYLQLVEGLAPSLETASAISAVQLLLRLSLDPVVVSVVRESHMLAVKALVFNLALNRSRWNTACEAICSYVYENIPDIELRILPIQTLSCSSSHLIDLRRRLAMETLFHTPGLGSKPVDPQLSFEKIYARLHEADFQPRHSSNLEQLRALTILFDVVVSNADFMRPSTHTQSTHATTSSTGTSSTTRPSPIPPSTKSKSVTNPSDSRPTNHLTKYPSTARPVPQLDHEFNMQIDLIAKRIKVIHDKILNKAENKPLKTLIDVIEKRLKYSVRTAPPPKSEIFAFADDLKSGGEGEYGENGVQMPKQRNFMKNWARRSIKEEVDGMGEDSMADESDVFVDADEPEAVLPGLGVTV
ncbi:hypothetical protein GGR57DRAFT_338816 [Xylariaceae sp. FL1272]|nr:hypothetical protein GGR57DRAFT_338816 [Xylariaceae sp. FL1272]